MDPRIGASFDISSMRLDVSSTLSHAKQILDVHREWMRKRNPAVVPLQIRESSDIQASREDLLEQGVTGDSFQKSVEIAWAYEEPEVMRNVSTQKSPTPRRTSKANRGSNNGPAAIRMNDAKAEIKSKIKQVSRNSVVPIHVDDSATSKETGAKTTPVPDVFFSPSQTSLPQVAVEAWTDNNLVTGVNGNDKTARHELDLTTSQQENDPNQTCNSCSDKNASSIKGDANEDYHGHLKQIHSTSTSTVIPIAPAPKHRTTSYLKQKHSKLGSEKEAIDFVQTSLPVDSDDEDCLLLHRICSKRSPAYIPESTIQPVLPETKQSATLRKHVNNSPTNLLQEKKTLERTKSAQKLSLSHQDSTSDSQLQKCTDTSPNAAEEVIPKSTEVVSSSSCNAINNDDLELLDASDEIPMEEPSSAPPKLFKSSLNNNSRVQQDLDMVEEVKSSIKFQPSRKDKQVKTEPVKEKPKSKLQNLQKIYDKNKVSSVKSYSPVPQRQKKNKKNKPKLHSGKTSANSKAPCNVAEETDESGVLPTDKVVAIDGNSLPCATTEVESFFRKDDSPEMEGDAVESDLPLPPLLRVRSGTSIIIPTDFKFMRKRQREPPVYSIHRTSNLSTLIPPCPIYGTVQPSEDDLIKSISRSVLASQQTKTLPKKLLVDEESKTNAELLKSKQEQDLLEQSSDTNNIDDFNENISKQDRLTFESSRMLGNVTTLSMEPGPLHMAAREGNLRRVQGLLAEGHDVNSLDGDRCTPLMYCILPEGHGVQLHCADLLIRRGTNLDHQAVDGSTALHLAAYAGALSLIELLLLNGANPDLRDCDGRLPLHWATKPQSIKPITELLKYSISSVNSPDGADMTPLMWAAYHKNALVLRYLLSNETADVEEKDIEGETAMHWAIHKDDVHCLQLLLTSDRTYFKNHKGRTVMHQAAKEGAATAAEFILQLRHDAMHDTDKMGRTPLHYAAVNNQVNLCYFLLTRGADATHRDIDGKLALDYARERQHEYAVALFTCHETSIADFTRMSRTINHALLMGSDSFSTLFLKKDNDNISVISESLDLLNDDITEENLSLHDPSATQPDNHFVASSNTEASKGSYLGLFPKNNKDPPKHYYFWVCSDKGTLCWSRGGHRRQKREARVYAIYTTPSKIISSRSDFSPNDLHRHAFWVATEKGVLDLLAYSKQAYLHWVKELESLSAKNSQDQKYVMNNASDDEIAITNYEDMSKIAIPFQGETPQMTSTPVRNNHLDPYQVM